MEYDGTSFLARERKTLPASFYIYKFATDFVIAYKANECGPLQFLDCSENSLKVNFKNATHFVLCKRNGQQQIVPEYWTENFYSIQVQKMNKYFGMNSDNAKLSLIKSDDGTQFKLQEKLKKEKGELIAVSLFHY